MEAVRNMRFQKRRSWCSKWEELEKEREEQGVSGRNKKLEEERLEGWGLSC